MIVRYIVKSYVVFITEKLLKVTENSYVRQDLIMIRIFNIYKNRNFAKLGGISEFGISKCRDVMHSNNHVQI